MVISAASPSPNFFSEKSYVRKIIVYFSAISYNFPCKIENFELEVVGSAILGTGLSSNLSLISLEVVLL